MTARLLLLVLALTATSGCGTLVNLGTHDEIYGGTSLDTTSIKHAWKEILNPDDPHELTPQRDAAVILASCADLPLSVFADTFTLPITGYHWVKEQIKPSSADRDQGKLDSTTGQLVPVPHQTAMPTLHDNQQVPSGQPAKQPEPSDQSANQPDPAGQPAGQPSP
jgi:uncharacterized protein YceK